jgi:chromosome segregation ATPase
LREVQWSLTTDKDGKSFTDKRLHVTAADTIDALAVQLDVMTSNVASCNESLRLKNSLLSEAQATIEQLKAQLIDIELRTLNRTISQVYKSVGESRSRIQAEINHVKKQRDRP